MPKFFILPQSIKHDTVTLSGEDVRHIRKVLRKKEGDTLSLSDGCGTDYLGEITAVAPDAVTLKVLEKHPCDSESPARITLFQCIPKSGKMDYVTQKCTELGVFEIVPVESERIVGKMENGQKVARYSRIALEAAKQCGRGIIPTVSSPVSFPEMLSRFSEFDAVLMPYENARLGSLRAVLSQKPRKIAVLIGPEGGFTEEEVALSTKAGAEVITLGKRILRTETAGSAVLAMILYELELS